MADSASLTSGIAGRWATALFELAEEEGKLETVERDLAALREALDDSADLRDLVSSPVYSRDQQARGVAAVAEKMGLDPLTRNVLALMAAKRRLFALRQTIRRFEALAAEKRGEVSAEVTAARPLSDSQRAALGETLKKSVGKDVKLNVSVDESLIGGLIVKVGSRMIDSSVRARLAGMKNVMKEVG